MFQLLPREFFVVVFSLFVLAFFVLFCASDLLSPSLSLSLSRSDVHPMIQFMSVRVQQGVGLHNKESVAGLSGGWIVKSVLWAGII